MQRQLEEGKREASREAELGDWIQRWQAWKARNLTLRYDPASRLQPSAHSTYTQNTRQL